MGMFLNSLAPFEAYKATKAGVYFVDRSELIGELIPAFGTEDRFYCITRPRRFGKSVMANIIGSFLGKAADARDLFCDLSIFQNPKYTEHLNKHHVFLSILAECQEIVIIISKIMYPRSGMILS